MSRTLDEIAESVCDGLADPPYKAVRAALAEAIAPLEAEVQRLAEYEFKIRREAIAEERKALREWARARIGGAYGGVVSTLLMWLDAREQS